MLTDFIALLDYDTPRGLRLHISSLAAPNFATSYTVGSVGIVDGSISYLYSSLPILTSVKSSDIDLHHVIKGYRHLRDLRRPDEDWWWEIWHSGKRIDRRGEYLRCCLRNISQNYQQTLYSMAEYFSHDQCWRPFISADCHLRSS